MWFFIVEVNEIAKNQMKVNPMMTCISFTSQTSISTTDFWENIQFIWRKNLQKSTKINSVIISENISTAWNGINIQLNHKINRSLPSSSIEMVYSLQQWFHSITFTCWNLIRFTCSKIKKSAIMWKISISLFLSFFVIFHMIWAMQTLIPENTKHHWCFNCW